MNETVNQTMDVLALSDIASWVLRHGPLILTVLLLTALVTHFIGKLIEVAVRNLIHSSRFTHRGMNEEDLTKRQNTLISLFTAIAHSVLWVIAVLIIVKSIFKELDLTPLLASASVIGVVVGLGAQSVIKDLLTGIIIISENQYRVGDVIDIDTGSGASGTVERISIRSTVLRDDDGNVHYVPNGTIAHVVNKTMGYSRVNLDINVMPDTNIDKLAKVIDETGQKLSDSEGWKDKILEAPKFTTIGTFSDTALEVSVTGKTLPSQQWSVAGELRRRLLTAFRKHGIELAPK
ncbi:mechanosensitive ion channel family protein [Candidatus Saccharibacteria bacterium]|nr:mechanosensitive ion channel family protein [Candidatus Saccharibacteria bacterium]